MTVSEAFEYVKPPVEGRFPTKPDDCQSVFNLMKNGLIPMVPGSVFLYAMPSDKSKGYYYTSPTYCRTMTNIEKEEFAKICEERKGSYKRPEKPKREKQKVEKVKKTPKMYPVFEDLAGSKIVCFDTETTGIGKDDEILQLTITGFVGDSVEVLYSGFYRPVNRRSWADAQNVHHISPKDVEDCPSFVSQLSIVKRFFDEADYVVGYNVPFDARMVSQSSCGLYNIPENKLVDPMIYYKEKKKEKGHKLVDACSEYCPERLSWFMDAAHDATADAVMTLEVLRAMGIKEGVDIFADKEKDRC